MDTQEMRTRAMAKVIPSVPLSPFIDGKFQDSLADRTFAVLDPSTGKEIARMPACDERDTARAVSAARKAFDEGPWPRLHPLERARYMIRLAELIDRYQDDLVSIETLDSGRPISGVQGWCVPHGAEVLRYYASYADKVNGELRPMAGPYHAYTLREPVGVCAQIIPWNFPFPAACWKLGPALAAGCTCILKPAERTPLSAQLLARLVQEADFPPGVVNIVCGIGEEAGDALIRDPRIDKVAFTGEVATATSITLASAKHLPRLSFELGGKCANIVCEDADVDAAVAGAYSAIFSCQGQNCCAASRTFIQESVYDEFIAKLKACALSRRVGDPFDSETEQGPQIDGLHRDRIHGYVERAAEAGARVLCGGKPLAGAGFFYEPTLVDTVGASAEIAREEIFGPVGCLFRFKDTNAAITAANDSRYGLAAGIWTRNFSLAQEAVKQLRVGTVWVNCFNLVDVTLPFGGFKQSGYGRELGVEALNGYLETKAVMIRL